MNEIEVRHGSPSQSLATPPKVVREEPIFEISAEEDRHLRDYWFIVSKRRWVVLLCMLVCFSTVAIGTLKQKPVFEGKVLIEINPEQPNILNFKEVLQVGGVDVDSYRETQYKVLQSRTLAERVINALHLYRSPEFYKNRRLLGLLVTDPDELPSARDTGPPNPQADYYRNSVKRFIDVINVSPVRRSNLVEVSSYSEDPKLAARIANQLANDYIEQNLQVKWDETVKASDWLQGQIVGLKAKLEKAEDTLQAYAQANSILFVEDRKNLANERLAQLQEAFTKAQADRYQKEASYTLVEHGKVQDLPGFLSNKLVQDLAFRLSELEREYSQLITTVKPDYPKAVALKKQIDTLQESLDRQKQALAENIVDEYRTALDNEKYLGQALEAQKREVNEIATKSIQYNILKREVDTSKQLYDGVLQRLKEAQVSAGLRASNIRVVDAAEVPKLAVKPRIARNLALGLILGLGFGLGMAFFLEYLDDTLKSPDEVESVLRLPSLGVLPSISANGNGLSAGDKLILSSASPDIPQDRLAETNYSYIEAFRSLRTSILLSAPVPKTLLVTSAMPSEGKTTISINLGVTLASLGSRVVVVDCDMRRPSCHRVAGVANKPGFVQCLAGQVDLASAILPVPGVANLSIIPCGPIPPNPTEVLSSRVTAEMLQRLRGMFDYVLVDSPPLLSVADARVISILCDAVVLVVRAFKTPHELVLRARNLLGGAGARILGVALNDVDAHRDYYSYGDSQHYGYGYSYGSNLDLAEDESRDAESPR